MESLYRRFGRELSQRLSSISRNEKLTIRMIALGGTLIIGILLLLKFWERYEALNTSEYLSVYSDHSIFFRTFRLTFELLIILFCIWPFKVERYLIAIAFFIWVFVEYFNWMKISLLRKKYAKELGINLPEPVTLGFYPAVWWDILVLLLVVVLFVWSVNILIRTLISLIKQPNTEIN